MYKISVTNGYGEVVEITARDFSIDENGISIIPFDATSFTDSIDFYRNEMQEEVEPAFYLDSVKIEEF